MAQENPLLELDDNLERPGFQTDDSSPLPQGEDISESQSEPSGDTIVAEYDADTKTSPIDESDWFEGEGGSRGANDDDDDHEFPQQAADSPSLRDHLNLQVNLSQITERNRGIVGLLIDSLDDDGYLTQDLEELVSLLPSEFEIDLGDLHIALECLQHLDPPGIGARNLAECLALQLHALPDDAPYLDKALLLVTSHLESLAARDFRLIKKSLHCDDDCLRSIQYLVTHLNPKPGSDFSTTVARYIVADVVVTKAGNTWVARLNPEAMPRLGINQYYASILKQNNPKNLS